MRSENPIRAAKISYIVTSVAFCVLGVLLIVLRNWSVSFIGVVTGIMLIAFGIVKLLGYFSKDLYRLAFQFDLAFGILLIALGGIIAGQAGTGDELRMPDAGRSHSGRRTVQAADCRGREGASVCVPGGPILALAVLAGLIGAVLALHPTESAVVHDPAGRGLHGGGGGIEPLRGPLRREGGSQSAARLPPPLAGAVIRPEPKRKEGSASCVSPKRSSSTAWPILIVALVLLVPAVFGMVNTRINYDMLDYLPEDMDTVIGQNELLEDFGKGAFSLLVVEDMPAKDVAALKEKIAAGGTCGQRGLVRQPWPICRLPMELLPDNIYNEVQHGERHADGRVFRLRHLGGRDHGRHPRRSVRRRGKQCFVTGMSALVTDLKDLCEQEEPIYVGIGRGAGLRRHDAPSGQLAGPVRVPGQHRRQHL